MKMKRKYTKTSLYAGMVEGHDVYHKAEGHTKREAVKKLRHLFSNSGIPTQPADRDTGIPVDLLTVVQVPPEQRRVFEKVTVRVT